MFCLGMVSTNLFMLFYAGNIQNSNCRRLEMATTYFFLQVGEICEVLPSSLSVDEHKHSPARMRYSNTRNVLYTTCRTTDGRRTDVVVVC